MSTGREDRAIESKSVIKAISALAQTHVEDGKREALPAPNVIDVLQNTLFELMKNPKVAPMERVRMLNDVQNISSELLRAVAVESGSRTMEAVTHANKGLETVTGTTFLEHTRYVKQLLVTLPSTSSPPGTYEALGSQIAAVERAYLNTVGKVLKDEQGIDVVTGLRQQDDAGIQRNGGRISDPREARGIPGIDRKPPQTPTE